jgi:hypothetical protein
MFWPPRGKHESSVPSRLCDHPGCDRAGEFRAPKSRDCLREYYWFCLDHVRDYNSSWDYYAGMRPEEIERMVRFDVTWQRPTWPLGHMGGFDPDKVRDPFHVFTEEVWQRPPPRPSAHSPEQAALQVMQLQAPLTVEALKARYKELCKLHHPDANGGDKDAEERFKRIGQAYKVLMESLHS